MSHIIDQSTARFLPGQVRKSLDHALSRTVLVQMVGVHVLLEWVSSLSEGLDEIQELRHKQRLAQTAEADDFAHRPLGAQTFGSAPLAQQGQVSGGGLEEYARVAGQTLGNCYQSYLELSEILETYRIQREVQSKRPITSH